jgi:hypothetical protein
MPTDQPTRVTRLCVLLACFAGHKSAAGARDEFAKNLRAHGELVDDVILAVDAKRRARVHDPHRVLAGVLTPALTWGVFGLLAGGDARGLIIWGVLGAICGGLFAYGSEHILAKNDLATIGDQLAPNTSAIVAFVECDEDPNLLEVAPAGATVTSGVTISPDLSAHSIQDGTAQSEPTAVSMTLLRFDGDHSARSALAPTTDPGTHVELLVEVAPGGRTRVVSPSQGVAAMSKSDIVSWGGFGIVFGFVAGFLGNGGVAGALEDGLVTGLAWAVFGLVAGALYGLWAGRATSARRIKSLRSLLPKGTSTALLWTVGPSTEPIAALARAGTNHVSLHFHPIEHGAVLQTS